MRIVGAVQAGQLRAIGKAKRDRRMQAYAVQNRREPTAAERALWNELARVPHRWVSQQILGGRYIVDFYAKRARLVVEVDGGYHRAPEQQAKDQARDAALEAQGFTVLRFSNEIVLANPRAIAQRCHDAFRANERQKLLAPTRRKQRHEAKQKAKRAWNEAMDMRRAKRGQLLPWETL